MNARWTWIALLLCLGSAPPAAVDSAVPLCDMTEKDAYKGEDGGLYGGGKNEPPAAHAEAAKAAAEKIQPLDEDGNPSKTGKVVLLSIGMSNTTQEFSAFLKLVGARKPGAALVIVDGAQGGQAAIQWDTSDARPWGIVENRLRSASVAAKQVQFVWIKQALIQQGQYGAFPAHAKKLQEELKKIVRIAFTKYPNLRIAYLSSRIYGGYAKGNLNPEPYAYEGAFSMRGLIREQIQGDKELSPDAAPLLLWGPYLWGDGVNARKCDGLTWAEADFAKDGTHPSESGRDKVAGLLQKFFKADPYVGRWFAN